MEGKSLIAFVRIIAPLLRFHNGTRLIGCKVVYLLNHFLYSLQVMKTFMACVWLVILINSGALCAVCFDCTLACLMAIL